MMNYTSSIQLIPENDPLRLEKLYQFEILDTATESDFDTIALLATEIFETQHAYISFVDRDRVFLKASNTVINHNSVVREESLSSLSILKTEVTVFPDIYNFHELTDSTFLYGKDALRFYAAAPIITADGFVLGTVSVTDEKPREEITDRQLKMLQLLAEIVMEKLEKRLANRKMRTANNALLHSLAHDMKNPITSISLYAQLLSTREMSSEKVFSMAARIEKSTKIIEHNLNCLIKN